MIGPSQGSPSMTMWVVESWLMKTKAVSSKLLMQSLRKPQWAITLFVKEIQTNVFMDWSKRTKNFHNFRAKLRSSAKTCSNRSVRLVRCKLTNTCSFKRPKWSRRWSCPRLRQWCHQTLKLLPADLRKLPRLLMLALRRTRKIFARPKPLLTWFQLRASASASDFLDSNWDVLSCHLH